MHISKKTYVLLFLIVIFSILIRLPNFFSPLLEMHDFRQTQTASNVWLYYKYGFNILKYHVPMFGGGYWMQEFPFYQAIVYFFTRFLGFHDYVGRLVSTVLFIVSLCPFYYICKSVFGKVKNALMVTFLYSIIPINIYFYRAFIPDPFTVTVSLFILALSFSLTVKFNLKKLISIYILILAGTVSKVTIVFTILFPALYLIYGVTTKQKNKRLIYCISAFFFLITILALFTWRGYTQILNASSFTLHDGTLKEWYLGTRFFSFDYYMVLLQRLIQELSLPGLIFILAGVYFLLKERSYFAKIVLFWILNILVYLFLFNNLNFIHNYYQLPLIPLAVVVLGFGLSYLKRKIANVNIYNLFLFSFLVMYYFYSAGRYAAVYAPYKQLTNNVFTITDVIKNCTKDNDKIIYVWPNADPNHPTILYYAKRIGYNLDLYNLSGIKEILRTDKDVQAIVINPVDNYYKPYIIKVIENNKVNISEKCFQNGILILDINSI